MLPGMGSRLMKQAASVGASGVHLEDGYYNVYVASGTATVSATFGSSGTVGNVGGPANYAWLVSGAAADYDIRATYVNVNGSNPSGGPYSTWLNLASNRGFSSSRSTTGENENTLTVSIALAGTGVPIATCTLSFLVQNNT